MKTGRAVFKVAIAATRDEVFREITRTDRPSRALPNTRLHTAGLEADARLQRRTANGVHTLADGVVVAHDPPQRFSHTLYYTRFRDPAFVVTYELRQAQTAVELVLTLDDLPLGTRTARTAMRESSRYVKDLKHVVENGRTPTLARMRNLWAVLMEFALPADMLVEHWPLEAPTRRRTTTLGG